MPPYVYFLSGNAARRGAMADALTRVGATIGRRPVKAGRSGMYLAEWEDRDDDYHGHDPEGDEKALTVTGGHLEDVMTAVASIPGWRLRAYHPLPDVPDGDPASGFYRPARLTPPRGALSRDFL